MFRKVNAYSGVPSFNDHGAAGHVLHAKHSVKPALYCFKFRAVRKPIFLPQLFLSEVIPSLSLSFSYLLPCPFPLPYAYPMPLSLFLPTDLGLSLCPFTSHLSLSLSLSLSFSLSLSLSLTNISLSVRLSSRPTSHYHFGSLLRSHEACTQKCSHSPSDRKTYKCIPTTVQTPDMREVWSKEISLVAKSNSEQLVFRATRQNQQILFSWRKIRDQTTLKFYPRTQRLGPECAYKVHLT